ncbi:MAG: L-threonylcarbamoyladenylate synthase, partial [Candidatus Veblenbacteria bacterium]|nr:L-threonylcarbamoyladenylate synthase [Candidatus Veblenbacteria bacterium]
VLRLKGRAVGKPLPLVAANFAMVVKYCRLTKSEQRVAKAFWPGPLTLVLKAKRKFPPGVQARDSTVGIRVPGSAWLRRLSAALGRPLVATSANRAGGVTLYSAAVVRRALAPRGLGYLVDAGRIKPRSTSTVVRLVGRRLIVLRPGTVSVQRLEHVLL